MPLSRSIGQNLVTQEGMGDAVFELLQNIHKTDHVTSHKGHVIHSPKSHI